MPFSPSKRCPCVSHTKTGNANRQTQRTNRYPSQHQPFPAELGTQYRTGGNTDGKQSKHQVKNIIVAAQMDLGKGRQLRGINRADKPKPRDADNGGKNGIVPHRFTQQGFCTTDNIPLDLGIGSLGGYGRHKQAAYRSSDGDQQNQYPDNIRRRA